MLSIGLLAWAGAERSLAQADSETTVAAGSSRPGLPFSIEGKNGIDWLVRPDGHPFFSLGVCNVRMGASREEFDPDNPGYAAWQHYGDAAEWGQATVKRLKSWGFTTIGAWSDFQTLKEVQRNDMTFIPVLHIGSTAGAPWWDMWDPKIIARMDQVARDQ